MDKLGSQHAEIWRERKFRTSIIQDNPLDSKEHRSQKRGKQIHL